MKLSLYLQAPNPKLPVRVIGNGYETANVPLGTLATVTKMTDQKKYQIVWDHLPDQPETFDAFGGMAMTLDVLFTARISHYYGKTPPVPEARSEEEGFYVDMEDIQAFVEKHGNIILSPPGRKPCKDQWFIWVTDPDGKFKQR
jgi:hypothetical protein